MFVVIVLLVVKGLSLETIYYLVASLVRLFRGCFCGVTSPIGSFNKA